ncbi:hypothetical protein FF2_037712 [Malus domestica]
MPFAPMVPLSDPPSVAFFYQCSGTVLYLPSLRLPRDLLRAPTPPYLTVAWSLTLSCIFLTLSLGLLLSVCGFFMIILHVLTITGATSRCAAAGSKPSCKWYGAHMVLTVLTMIPRVIGGAGVHKGLFLQISCLSSSTTSMLFLLTASRHLSSAALLV